MTALLNVMNDILRALDGGNISVLTLLDLSAAFDTIDHKIYSTDLKISMAFLARPYHGLSLILLEGLKW